MIDKKRLIFNLVILFFTWVNSKALHATTYTGLALRSQGNISKKFHQNVKFCCNLSGEYKVLYGSDKYGIYSVGAVANEIGEVSVAILPPGYKWPVSVKILKGNKVIHEKVINFKSPLPKMFNSINVTTNGNPISANYLLVSGALPQVYDKEFHKHIKINRAHTSFPMILNRHGEIVWVHFPDYGRRMLGKYITTKVLSPGKYGFLAGDYESYFEVVSISGNITLRVEGSELLPQKVLRNDFIPSKQNSLLFLTNMISYYRARFLEPPFSYLGVSVSKLIPPYSRPKDLWKSFKHFHPKRYSADLPVQKKIKLTSFSSKSKRIDYLHGNSFSEFKNGYLFSFREPSQVAYISKDFNKKIWSVGKKSDNYKFANPKEAFYMQHHATLIGENRLMVFDNGKSTSQVKIFDINHKAESLSLRSSFKPKESLHSPTRGSAYELSNGNIIASFPATAIGKITFHNKNDIIRQGGERVSDQIIEFSRAKGLEVGRVTIDFQGGAMSGNRALPLMTLGAEGFMGYNFEHIQY